MANRPSISIVTPTRNRRGPLARAIASVAAQSEADYEHLIVDDASSDGTADYVRGLGDTRVRFHRTPIWRGANAARNYGVRMARAPIVTFLDSDDEFLPHRLEHTLGVLRSNRSTQVVLSSFHTVKQGRAHASGTPHATLDRATLEAAVVAHAFFLGGSSITVRRPTLLRCGGFAPGLQRLQDRDLLLALSRRCGARLLGEADWKKHVSPDSISLPTRGFVAALAALLQQRPGLRERHECLVRYNVARTVVHDLLQGRLLDAAHSYRVNRRLPQLGFSLRELIAGYASGKRERRRIAETLRRGGRRGPPLFVLADAATEGRAPPQAA